MTDTLALADCGPCSGTGAHVRDHLPLTLSPEARQLCLIRLEHGAQVYGAPLRKGWSRALIELLQELLDGVAYASADDTMPPEDLAKCRQVVKNLMSEKYKKYNYLFGK